MKRTIVERIQSSRTRFAERMQQQLEGLRQKKAPDFERGLEDKERLLQRYHEQKAATVEARQRSEQRFKAEIERLDTSILRLEDELETQRNLLRGVAVVPDLVERPEIEAFVALQKVGLQTGTRTEEPGSDKIGHVLAQDPAASSELALGSAVALTIGGIQVPAVVGLTVAQARKQLEKKQLSASIGEDQTGSHVASQKPVAGTYVASGTEVELTLTGRDLATRNKIVDLMQGSSEFVKIGFSVRKLKARLDALGIVTREQLSSLLERSDEELREDLGLPTPRNARVFKHLLDGVLRSTRSAPPS